MQILKLLNHRVELNRCNSEQKTRVVGPARENQKVVKRVKPNRADYLYTDHVDVDGKFPKQVRISISYLDLDR